MLNCWVVSVCSFSRDYLSHQGLSYQESYSLLCLFINSYIRILSIPAAVESDFFLHSWKMVDLFGGHSCFGDAVEDN